MQLIINGDAGVSVRAVRPAADCGRRNIVAELGRCEFQILVDGDGALQLAELYRR
jgi:hypothetical protein